MPVAAGTAERVAAFYERHPYPPPRDDVDVYRGAWDTQRRRADACLLWPGEPFRDERTILVAGCGTMQAAHYAVRWPLARIVGIDVSTQSLRFERQLKEKHGLENLELRVLPLERVRELGERFDLIVCTGVLHHLRDPDAGLRALADALAPSGALHLMVYAPYGRAGIAMLQQYCRYAGVEPEEDELRDLAATLKAVPLGHPVIAAMRESPDFDTVAGLADALLHPRERAYSVPQLFDFIEDAGLRFGRWLRQAPYLPQCGAIAATPHAQRLANLATTDQYAALELFRGAMMRHNAIMYRADTTLQYTVDFHGEAWLSYIPVRVPDTIVVREHLPPGSTAVLINRAHTFTDLYLPIDPARERLLAAADGKRTIAQIARELGDLDLARAFYQQLWEYDQVVFSL